MDLNIGGVSVSVHNVRLNGRGFHDSLLVLNHFSNLVRMGHYRGSKVHFAAHFFLSTLLQGFSLGWLLKVGNDVVDRFRHLVF